MTEQEIAELRDENARLNDDLRAVRAALDAAGWENRVAHLADGVADIAGQRDVLHAAVIALEIISSNSGPAAPIFDEFDAAVERNRGRWYAIDAEPIDHLQDLVRGQLKELGRD